MSTIISNKHHEQHKNNIKTTRCQNRCKKKSIKKIKACKKTWVSYSGSRRMEMVWNKKGVNSQMLRATSREHHKPWNVM